MDEPRCGKQPESAHGCVNVDAGPNSDAGRAAPPAKRNLLEYGLGYRVQAVARSSSAMTR